MVLSEFLKGYRNGVKVATGTYLSVKGLATLLGVKQDNLDKWERRKNLPQSDIDRISIKAFFGIDNLVNISDKCLNDAIARYPKGLAKIADIKNPKPTTIALNPQSNNTDGTTLPEDEKDDNLTNQNDQSMNENSVWRTLQKLSDANKDLAESNKSLAQSVAECLGMLKEKRHSGKPEPIKNMTVI